MTNAFVCLIILNLSDLFGRRFILALNSVMIVIFMAASVLFNDFLLKMFMLGRAFGCEGNFIPLFIILMMESTSRTQLIAS